MRTALRRLALACLLATGLVVAVAPAADARKVTSRSATGVLPGVDPVGKLKPRERIAKISARTAKGAEIEVFFQIYCFDDQLTVHRRSRTLTGTGHVHGKLRRPRGKSLDCSTDAAVRVRSRPAPPAGERLEPIRLIAVIRAFRR
jgi:hypothetical protein